MITIDTLIHEGVVKAAASMFPTMVNINSSGTGACRFILALDQTVEDHQQWYAFAWQTNRMGGSPAQILGAQVERIFEFGPSKIALFVPDAGGHIVVTPDPGCGCGATMKHWNPAAPAQLAAMGRPSEIG